MTSRLALLTALAGCSLPTPTALDASSTHITNIFATGTDVYWTDSGAATRHRVMHTSTNRATWEVADTDHCPAAIAADDTTVFWLRRCATTVSAIVSAPRAGGEITALVDPQAFDSLSLQDLVVTAGMIYVSVATAESGQIIAIPKDGAPYSVAVANLSSPGALAVDDTNLYWIDTVDAAIYKHARTGDPSAPPIKLASLAADNSRRVIPAIATDGTRLYWSDADARVHGLRIADGAPFDVPTTGTPDAFALDDSYVYWIAGTTHVIDRAPLDGGAAEQVAAIDDPSGYPAAAIAVTADAVIWADNPDACDTTITDCNPTTIESVPK